MLSTAQANKIAGNRKTNIRTKANLLNIPQSPLDLVSEHSSEEAIRHWVRGYNVAVVRRNPRISIIRKSLDIRPDLFRLICYIARNGILAFKAHPRDKQVHAPTLMKIRVLRKHFPKHIDITLIKPADPLSPVLMRLGGVHPHNTLKQQLLMFPQKNYIFIEFISGKNVASIEIFEILPTFQRGVSKADKEISHFVMF